MISTNTTVTKPIIRKIYLCVKRALNYKINATLIKSKRDYISLGLISQILKDESNNYKVNILKMQFLIWVTTTNTGDIQELNLKGGQRCTLNKVRNLCSNTRRCALLQLYKT